MAVGGNYPACGWFVWPDQGQKHRAAISTNGSPHGTSSYLMRRHDGVDWAVLSMPIAVLMASSDDEFSG